jgi:probable phosphoglycerate mutase
MRSFYFIRHGQTDWNAIGRMQGQSDIPLNATGLQQAKEAAEKFVGLDIDRIVSSPLKRASVTAQIICDRIGARIFF